MSPQAQPRSVSARGQEEDGPGPFGFIIENRQQLALTPLTTKERRKENWMPGSEDNNIHFFSFPQNPLGQLPSQHFSLVSLLFLWFPVSCFCNLTVLQGCSTRASSFLYQYPPTPLLNASAPESADGPQVWLLLQSRST